MDVSDRLRPDTQVTLLLCSAFGLSEGGPKALNVRQYNRIAGWLRQENLRPGDLLRQEVVQCLVASSGLSEAETAQQLLQRGALLGMMVEKWAYQGVWVVSRGEAAYPQRLKNRLGSKTPPLLFGVGPISLLYRGGLAVVGSREADHDALLFTQKLARLCVQEGVQILSGGAKGVDLTAMGMALALGGNVVGVLPDSLGRESRSGKYLRFIKGGQLTLVSPFHPDAGFRVGNAMGRNRFIYLLSEYALAVRASAVGEGGTWLGASDNLKKGWVPLIVRDCDPLPEGNKELIAQGAKPLGKALFEERFSLRNWISTFFPVPGWKEKSLSEKMLPPKTAESSVPHVVPEKEIDKEVDKEDFWQATVWPRLQIILQVETSAKELAEKLQIENMQAMAWLKRALKENKVKKMNRPARYVIFDAQEKQGNLNV